ncbi:MAG: type II secretion system F family protein, partial [Allosphingosinicella sp.]
MTIPASGPTVMGIDVVMVATFMAAVATFAVLVAIYAATTVKDPMAKRVKALNERREQLKAGIVASTSKRRRNITNKNEVADKVRSLLGSLKMLQAEQVEKAQKKLMQAGIRSKDLAFVVIFARLVLPIVIGTTVILGVYYFDWFPEWGPVKRYGLVAASLIGSYKAPDLWLKNKINKRSSAVRKGLPDALDLLVICAEAGLTVDAAFNRVARELGKAYPELGDEFALTSIELGFLTDRRSAFENLANRIDLDAVRGVVTTMIQTEKYG